MSIKKLSLCDGAALLDTSSCARLDTEHSFILHALWNNQSIGTAVVQLVPALLQGEIHQFAIDPAYREREIETEVLKRIEQELREQEAIVLSMIYEVQNPDTPWLEKLFRTKGWNPPETLLYRWHFDARRFHPPWYEKKLAPKQDFEQFLWCDLSPTESERLHQQMHLRGNALDISPWGSDRARIEPLNSLGLRYRGKLVGWMITHRMTADTIRYSALWVQSSLRSQGHSVRLLTSSIEKQQMSPITQSYFEINVARSLPSWRHFIDKRLAPYSQSTSQSRFVWKNLSSDSQPLK